MFKVKYKPQTKPAPCTLQPRDYTSRKNQRSPDCDQHNRSVKGVFDNGRSCKYIHNNMQSENVIKKNVVRTTNRARAVHTEVQGLYEPEKTAKPTLRAPKRIWCGIKFNAVVNQAYTCAKPN